MELHKNIEPDPWKGLKLFTDARIALGKTGVSIPVAENLQFKMAHAFARDAIYKKMEVESITESLLAMQLSFFQLQSQANSRQQFLQRPDLGKSLLAQSVEKITREDNETEYDICINIADGLSATAVNQHAIPVLQHLLPLLQSSAFRVAPVCMIEQGRVAISDETGSLLRSKISLILIGERPGLSSPDSLGVYLTFHPQKGNRDAMRNCISNIRPKGLTYAAAAEKIYWLCKESLRLQLSGVVLKDYAGLLSDHN